MRAVTSIQIRRASALDAEKLHNLHTRTVLTCCASHYTDKQLQGWLCNRTPAGYLDSIRSGEVTVALAGLEVVGFAHATTSELLGLFVAPEAQGDGVGSLLLNDALIRLAPSSTLEATLNAVAFYERHDFTRLGLLSVNRGTSQLTLEKMVRDCPVSAEFAVSRLQVDQTVQLRQVRTAALTESPDAFGETLAQTSAEDWEARALRGATCDDRAVFLALADEHPIGMVFVKCSDSPQPAFLGSMWVAPSARGRGVGAELVRQGLRFLRENKQTEVELWVTIDHHDVISFYRSFGFEETTEQADLRIGSDRKVQRLRRPLW